MGIMQFFSELFSNRILMSAMLAWFLAQLCKTLLCALIDKTWNWERMVGAGGMPSSHAATVCALVIAVAFNYGPASFQFTISLLFAIIVLHDARGVRFETGKQAAAIMDLYDILETLTNLDLPEPERLKLLVGHTPLQVLVGGVIGVIVGLLYH